jgi:branched-chain amino acid transport system substrate-binding protein
MSRTKRLLVASVAVAVMGFSFSSCQPGSGSGPRVGVILPLTGDAAVYGQALKKGIDLAMEQLSAKGEAVPALLFEDDRGQAAQSVTAARRLIDVEKVPLILGGAMSSTAEAIVPICNDSHVVLISPTATKPALTRMGHYFFRLWPSDDYDGKIMAEAAYQKLHLRRISVLYINLAYGVGITQVFTHDFQALGGTIISSDGYTQGATDFRSLLTKIQASNPDAIYLPGYVAEIANILKQASELGIKSRFLGVNSLYDPKLIEVAGPAAEGAVFTYPTFDPKSQQSVVASFVQAFKTKYGSDPDAFAAQGYDTLRVVARVRGAAGATGDEIRQKLLSLGRFDGPGGSFTFDANGDVQKELRLLTVKNGSFVPFEG